jgi:phosphatidylserine/phosphatidylglycerophosphate/cardiolipin synthase-like enzyme
MITQAYLENIQPQILIELDQAKRNIVLAIAWLTDQQIFDKLCEKSASGIVVELMIYDDEINNNIDFSLLEKVGGKLYKIENQDSKTLDHNKFCVIDFSTVINGSYNWGQIAPQIQETITVSSNAGDLAHQFINEFQRLKEKYIKNQAQTSAFDLAKVLNRLKLIKTLIDLGENRRFTITDCSTKAI